YNVYRQTYAHKQFLPGPWDWLYGQGYGLSWYESPWFGWWGRGCVIAPDWWYGYYPWWQPASVRELVMQGEGKLDEQGKLTITIDSADALKQHGDQDHQYIVEAQVRDASRRVITGKGNVLATRQAYFTTLQPTRGYYRSGDQMEIKIICRNPDGSPVQTKGQLVISKVQWTGAQNTTINEVELDRQPLETDASGMATISYRYENTGQLKFHFTSPDSWGSTVEGFGLVWVVGNQFDGKLHRFNDLELITDKRTYEPGQTAHVMINTKQANSYVLLSTDAQNGVLKNWKLIHVKGKSTVIDVPVENKHRPNFFIEAVTVSDAKLHQQLAQICVPPANSMLDITVQTDKPTYQPGETATVNIIAKDMTGKPAQTQVVLSAFDQSLLYIAGRTSGNMGSYYHGQQNHHNLNSQTNLGKQFTHAGNITDPSTYRYATPEDWDGQWGPQVDDWRITSGDEILELGALQRRGVRASGGIANFADGVVSAPAPAAMPMMEAAAADSSVMAKSELKVAGDVATVQTESQAEQPVSTRENFADTALWVDAITTDDNGKATASFTVPDNLTTWQIDSWAMSKTPQVGQGETQATATKNLLVRLQTPRFFVQRDEVVITANVHNYLDHDTTVEIDLDIPMHLLLPMESQFKGGDIDFGNGRKAIVPATHVQTIPAGGEVTVNWWVKATNEGMARIAVSAKGKDASDAMAMTIPVIIHGSLQQQAQTAVIASGVDDQTINVELNLPDQIDPKQTELYVSFSPTLIGTMLDALPYLLDYPYGCTEQTISRFVPAVQVRKTLQDMGLTLADIKKNFPAKQVDGKPYQHPWNDSPIFDDQQMDKLIDAGLNRILSMQNGDGGWGWWKGTDSRIYL
ncbi:MAG: alpha-2-macroglobulin family protein, partial [Phycisphaeraceae bacterium JB051]